MHSMAWVESEKLPLLAGGTDRRAMCHSNSSPSSVAPCVRMAWMASSITGRPLSLLLIPIRPAANLCTGNPFSPVISFNNAYFSFLTHSPSNFFAFFPHLHTIRRWSGTMSVKIEYPPIIPMLVDYADLTIHPKRTIQNVSVPSGVNLHVLHVKFPHTNWGLTKVNFSDHYVHGDTVLVLWLAGMAVLSPDVDEMQGWRLEVLIQLIAVAANQHAVEGRFTIVGLDKVHPALLGQRKTPPATVAQLFNQFKPMIRAIFHSEIGDDKMVDDMIARTRLLTHHHWAWEMGNVIGTEWEDDLVFNVGCCFGGAD